MLYSKSCAPKYRAQMIEPCASCQQLVNGDFKCQICKKHIHLSCSATKADDGVVDVVCPDCHFMNDEFNSNHDGKKQSKVAKGKKQTKAAKDCELLLLLFLYFIFLFTSYLTFIFNF